MTGVQGQVQKVEGAIAAARAKGRSTVAAQELLDQVLLDRGAGAHNPQKAAKLLDAAIARLSGAR